MASRAAITLLRLTSKSNGVQERFIVWFDAHAVVQHERDAVLLQGFLYNLDRPHAAQTRIGEHQDPPDAQVCQIHAHLAGNPGAEADARSGHFKCGFVFHESFLYYSRLRDYTAKAGVRETPEKSSGTLPVRQAIPKEGDPVHDAGAARRMTLQVGYLRGRPSGSPD